jgi:hypothetical protein
MLSEIWLSRDGAVELRNLGSVRGAILSRAELFFLNLM